MSGATRVHRPAEHRSRRIGGRRGRMGSMADPLATVSDLLRPVFAEIGGGGDVDPVVRPSDRADAQVNGALPLAKQLGDGTTPRQIAERVVASGVLDAVCSTVEIAGPGCVNLTFDPGD